MALFKDCCVTDPTVYFKVSLNIHSADFDAFAALAQQMIAATRQEPGNRGYAFFLSADRSRCRLLETYAGAEAAAAHLAGSVVGQMVPELLKLATLDGFEVYGDPGPAATAMLAAMGAEIFLPLAR